MKLLAAFISGVLASMGVGGGMVLILYLTIFAGYSQTEAQGINLIYFIPTALISLIIHSKNGLIEWKSVLPAIFCGVIFAAVGSYLALNIDPSILRRCFGGFVLLIGIKELFLLKTG